MPDWKAEPPAPLARFRATRADKKAMKDADKVKHTCLRCKTVYRHTEYVQKCQAWHKERRRVQTMVYNNLSALARDGEEQAQKLLKKWKWRE